MAVELTAGGWGIVAVLGEPHLATAGLDRGMHGLYGRRATHACVPRRDVLTCDAQRGAGGCGEGQGRC